MKRLFILLTILVGIILIASCGAEAAQTNPNDSSYTLTLDQLQHDPMSFTGSISVMGIVGDYGLHNFSIYENGVDFELAIDYRGNQVLPAMGTEIIATGRMNYRPCCGPHLVATSFREVQP